MEDGERKIITGRYAQPKDPYQGFWEKHFTSIPTALLNQPDFVWRTGLRHRNEFAVDEPFDGHVHEGHRLYRTPEEYDRRFALRTKSAIRHIRKIYQEWKTA